jgi:hypothetical protein
MLQGYFLFYVSVKLHRSCGQVVRVPGYRSRGPGSIAGATRLSDKQWLPVDSSCKYNNELSVLTDGFSRYQLHEVILLTHLTIILFRLHYFRQYVLGSIRFEGVSLLVQQNREYKVYSYIFAYISRLDVTMRPSDKM